MSEPTNSGAAPAAAIPPSKDSATGAAAPESRDQNAAPAKTDETPKLSAAELKKKAKAEKQARRALAKATEEKGESSKQAKPQKDQKPAKESKQPQKEDKPKALPVRRRGSQSNVAPPKTAKKETKKEEPEVGPFFGHLSNQKRLHTIAGANKEVHPAILALGLQFSNYVVCGSTARMVAMLLAFKEVIRSYQTPPGKALSRHMVGHSLNPQIEHLKSCRELNIGMGNAIRWLKELISQIDISVTDIEAKKQLYEEIDNFILHRVIAAGEMISENAVRKINQNDVILTYGRSSIVEKTLLRAHKEGKSFSVIIVDSKPLFEGKHLAQFLAQNGISVRYLLISGAAHAMKGVSKVFLGASAMYSNGRLFSRVGTAGVSMLAHSQNIPIIVLCESVKFTEKVILDSIVHNELANADEIFSEADRAALVSLNDAKGGEDGAAGSVVDLFNVANLHVLQVLYDVTPAEYINMVITEHGYLPPSSVPVVHRISTNL